MQHNAIIIKKRNGGKSMRLPGTYTTVILLPDNTYKVIQQTITPDGREITQIVGIAHAKEFTLVDVKSGTIKENATKKDFIEASKKPTDKKFTGSVVCPNGLADEKLRKEEASGKVVAFYVDSRLMDVKVGAKGNLGVHEMTADEVKKLLESYKNPVQTERE